MAVKNSLAPMEALLVGEIPTGKEWQYEPKWDGFRCLAFGNSGKVRLQSKSGKPLDRYFPELVAALKRLSAKHFILDGEIVIPVAHGVDFDQLLQRIHPAASRVKKLAAEHPAHFMVFDLLADQRGVSLIESPLKKRRPLLEGFSQKFFKRAELLHLSPATVKIAQARKWLEKRETFLDGIIAKRTDLAYAPGERTAMQKYKRIRTADCVVGGFRYSSKSKSEVGSLLLGLYENGLLNHVGFTSGIKAEDRKLLLKKLLPWVEAPGFTGQKPGGPSRWSTARSEEWQPLKPKFVVEVSFDHVTGGRFRHGTHLIRWRPDKAPKQCTIEQIAMPKIKTSAFDLVADRSH
jgi:ATP-dependent DNA ligase